MGRNADSQRSQRFFVANSAPPRDSCTKELQDDERIATHQSINRSGAAGIINKKT